MHKEKATLRRSSAGGRHGVKIVLFFSFSAPSLTEEEEQEHLGLDHNDANVMASLWPWQRDLLEAMPQLSRSVYRGNKREPEKRKK